jgi:hypothetical protein
MTAITFTAAPLVAALTPKIRGFFNVLSEALDSFAEARMRNAVPEWALRQSEREIRHYRHLIHRSGKLRRDRKGSARRASALRPGF